MKFFQKTWLNGSYPVSTWSCFDVKIRTNNDLEGWNNGLKQMANHNTSLYALCAVLEKEARTIALNEQFVSLYQVQRAQRRVVKEFEEELNKLYLNFSTKKIDSIQLHSQLTNLLKLNNK